MGDDKKKKMSRAEAIEKYYQPTSLMGLELKQTMIDICKAMDEDNESITHKSSE